MIESLNCKLVLVSALVMWVHCSITSVERWKTALAEIERFLDHSLLVST
jgi:hypothetical protein